MTSHLYSTWCVIYCSHMRRLLLERSRWLSPRGSLLKKERGTFISWRMSRHSVVPPLYSPVRRVAERRGAAWCDVVWLWRGCCTLYGSTLCWGRRDTEPSGRRHSGESRSPPTAGRLEVLLSVPRLTRSSPARPPCSLQVPTLLPEPLFSCKFLLNYFSTRWAGIIQETDNLSTNLVLVKILITIIKVSTWLLPLLTPLVVCVTTA